MTGCDIAKEIESRSPAGAWLKQAVALLNRWMDDPDQDGLLGDTDKFVRNLPKEAL